jgi:hypothetical protein
MILDPLDQFQAHHDRLTDLLHVVRRKRAKQHHDIIFDVASDIPEREISARLKLPFHTAAQEVISVCHFRWYRLRLIPSSFDG